MDFEEHQEANPQEGSPKNSTSRRRERLRRLATEILTNDQLANHTQRNTLVSAFECRLCLTIHESEKDYLTHIECNEHRERSAKKNQDINSVSPPLKVVQKTNKLGAPKYFLIKQKDTETNRISLLFQIFFPNISTSLIPAYKFSFLDEKTAVNGSKYQLLLFAAEPYETIAFKIPKKGIDSIENQVKYFWDGDQKIYFFEVTFNDYQKN